MDPVPQSKSKYTAVPLHVLVYIAWRNLTSKKLRTLLTMFGVTIGIGAIFFLLSFGFGLRNLVTQQVVGDKSIKSIDVVSPSSKILKLDTETLNKVRHLPHVTQIGSAYTFPGSLAYKGGEVDAVSYGVDSNYEALDELNLLSGRLLTNQDTHAVLLNAAALKSINLTSASKAIGKTVSITIPLTDIAANKSQIKADFKIVGVIDSTSGSEIYIPNGIFQGAGVPYYSQVKLTADNSDNVNGIRKQIESLGLQTNSPIDTLDQINQVFKFFTIILIGFGGIGMVVSVLGMFNTLTISLLERTKEIGLMMALGGRNSDMSRLFIFEAMLLSVLGAIFGVALAMTLGRLVQIAMNAFAHHRGVQESFQIFSNPWWAIVGSIVFMLIVGLLVAFFPAKHAQHINPIDALRRE